MSIRIDFNAPIDGGSGRKDLMRVLASAGPISDDLNPAVVFSSQYGASLGEKVQATITGMTPGGNTTASGSLTLSRKYENFPLLLISYTQDDGVVIQPYSYVQVYSRPNGQSNGGYVRTLERAEIFAADVISLGSNSYRVDYVLQNFGTGSTLRNGVLRVYAFGKGV